MGNEPVIGQMERVVAGQVSGWAVATADPRTPVLLEIRVDGVRLMTVCADQKRLDAGAEGDHGFIALLPRHVMDGGMHEVTVVHEATGVELRCAFDPMVRLPAPDAEGAEPNAQAMSPLFDDAFYRSQLPGGGPDVADAMVHYRTQGWRAGLNPHPLFDTAFVVAQRGGRLTRDPLADFIGSDPAALRDVHPLFCAASYHRARPDVVASGTLPLVHYIRHGWREGLGPSPFFDPDLYRAQAGLDAQAEDPLAHYLRLGWRAGHRPHRDFDPACFHRLAGLPAGTEPFGHFIASLARGEAPEQPQSPVVSVLIPAFEKPLLTLQCLHHLRRHTPLAAVEIIVVDNASSDASFALLCRHAGGARVLRLSATRGFGEAMNLAAEQARGQVLVFLNNDAFVTARWLRPLLQVLDDPAVGAVGPKFLYPDGRVQECGAQVMPCGATIQRGKGADAGLDLYDTPEMAAVDYVSAACMAVRASDFHALGGFDLCWDPAYYEDVDLCLRLRLAGRATRYAAASQVVHVENATWSDPMAGRSSAGVVDANRQIFVGRWGAYLSGASDGTAERALLPTPRREGAAGQGAAVGGRPKLGLFTPHPLTPGGGERYLLSIVGALAEGHDCMLVTPERYSRARLATMGRELGLDLSAVTPVRLVDAPEFDVFVAMGNHVLPPVPPMGRRNVYHCQFPFPLASSHFPAGWEAVRGYDAVMVNSAFTAAHVRQAAAELGLVVPPIHVVPPPVPQVGLAPRSGPGVILHVGRFAPDGHCKRQDLMIGAFARLLEGAPEPLELHLAGVLGVDEGARGYLAGLRRTARGLPVSFHVNPQPGRIHALYRRATVYWHVTGAEADVERTPEVFEHFGITIAEAMSAGAIPVVLRHGGPAELVVDGHDGFLVGDAGAGLVAATRRVLALEPEARAVMAGNAAARAARYAPAAFEAGVRAMLAAIRSSSGGP